jgi:uncharacterized protein YdhG (YjbR/CyaY superfamily)
MILSASNVAEYLEQVPEERKAHFNQLRKTILDNLPQGFKEEMNYGMIGFVVPHTEYPAGYHCDPQLPLPFAAIASQKNFIALYHMGLYADPKILEWFMDEFPKRSTLKLDMGKSCIRFKNPEKIPFELIGELMQKISLQDFIRLYEANYPRKKQSSDKAG